MELIIQVAQMFVGILAGLPDKVKARSDRWYYAGMLCNMGAKWGTNPTKHHWTAFINAVGGLIVAVRNNKNTVEEHLDAIGVLLDETRKFLVLNVEAIAASGIPIINGIPVLCSDWEIGGKEAAMEVVPVVCVHEQSFGWPDDKPEWREAADKGLTYWTTDKRRWERNCAASNEAAYKRLVDAAHPQWTHEELWDKENYGGRGM